VGSGALDGILRRVPAPPAPPGIDAAAVEAFLVAHVPGIEPPLVFELIGDGRSNLTYRVTGRNVAAQGGRPGSRPTRSEAEPSEGHVGPGGACVLRRPPLGHVLPTAHDMAREHRVLAALAGSDVPVPRPLALCEDPAVSGAPFYVMEWRPGVVVADRLPEGFATTAQERRRIGFALVEVLARLHAVDFAAAGLGDFGRPEGYLARQVRRWAQQWERSKTGEVPAVDDLGRRLAAALPVSPAPSLVHGDYRLGNVALDPADPGRVVAVYDWEMATLGDPLTDLAWLLVSWAEAGDSASSGAAAALPTVTAQPGFASRRELKDTYARASGRDLAALEFYEVLAFYKLAVISEGIWARHRMGKTVGETFVGIGRASVALAGQGLALADAAADPRLRGTAS
jgi:aminoglycoside phosphotransferase (APT) family kinase protein